jgi:signal transduction histidine kinase
MTASFDEALQRAKLDALKELAYGASHEINNPLANIATRAQTLLRDETDPERRRMLEAIRLQALRAHEMISDLMLFARPPEPQRESVDVGELVGRVAEEFRVQCRERRIALSLDRTSDLPPLWADREQLAVALTALVANAVEAIGSDGAVLLRAATQDVDVPQPDATGELRTGRVVVLEVIDDGPGIAAEALPKIFDPFYSGREAGRGLGFGLSKCWRIVELHGGRVSVVNNPTRGVTARIELPAS